MMRKAMATSFVGDESSRAVSRQTGSLAAAGCVYERDHHVERLKDDHAKAGTLADGLRDLGLVVPNDIETNGSVFDASTFR